MTMAYNKVPAGIYIRVTIDVGKSSYQYHTANVRNMMNKFPIEVKILPGYLPYIMDALFTSERMYKEEEERAQAEYLELYKKFNGKKNGKKNGGKKK